LIDAQARIKKDLNAFDADVAWEYPRIYPEDLVGSRTFVEFYNGENLNSVMTENGRISVYGPSGDDNIDGRGTFVLKVDPAMSLYRATGALVGFSGTEKSEFFPSMFEFSNSKETPYIIQDSLYMKNWVR
jgi:hypothetical protein